MASFIFQMHIHAQETIEDWWTIEDLPSLTVGDIRNQARIVNLTGLGVSEAEMLVERYLKDYRVEGASPTNPLHPFSAEIVKIVRDAEGGNPRGMLRKLGTILDNAKLESRSHIDLAFVEPFLEKDYEDEVETDEDPFDNPER